MLADDEQALRGRPWHLAGLLNRATAPPPLHSHTVDNLGAPLSRIALDSTNPGAIPADWPLVIGYATGRESAWPAATIQKFRSRGTTLALIDVTGEAPEQASIIDFEPGDVQREQTLQNWVRARNNFRADATVYCDRDELPEVLRYLSADYFRLWLADPTADGKPPTTPPKLALPKNCTLIGVQYAQHPGKSPGDYDLSIIYDKTWHPSATERTAAAVEPHDAAAAAAAPPITIDDDGQALDDGQGDEPAAADPTEPDPTSLLPAPTGSVGDPGPAPDGDATSSPTTSPATPPEPTAPPTPPASSTPAPPTPSTPPTSPTTTPAPTSTSTSTPAAPPAADRLAAIEHEVTLAYFGVREILAKHGLFQLLTEHDAQVGRVVEMLGFAKSFL